MSLSDAPATPRADHWRELRDLPDDRLVERARERDLAAFEALMRRHNRRRFRVTRSVLRDGDAAQDAVQDAVQETYLRAFTRLDSYQPKGHFGAWITRVALNEALMIRRRIHGDTVSLDEASDEALRAEAAAVSDTPSVDQFVEAAHARALLEHAIDALPENFRTVFKLRGELSRRLRTESTEVFDFGLERCDAVATYVLARLSG